MSHLRPWLILASFVMGLIQRSLELMPSAEAIEEMIREWADLEGFQIAAIEAPKWFDRLLSLTHDVYRVRVLDQAGCERTYRAGVGRFLLDKTFEHVKITEIEPR
jgi:hypothetical protein